MAGIVQSVSTVGIGSIALAYNSNNAAGNLLVVAVGAATNGKTFAVSDTQGNTYQSLSALTDVPATSELQIFYVLSCKAGANTVTFDPTVAVAANINLHEFTPVTGIGTPFSSTGTGSPTTSGVSTTPSGINFAFVGGTPAGGGIFSPGTGWTSAEGATFNLAISAVALYTMWKLGGGSTEATATISFGKGGALTWVSEVVGYSARLGFKGGFNNLSLGAQWNPW
jgi:hypothetical protein